MSSPKPTIYQIERNRSLRLESGPKTSENVPSSSLPFAAAATAAAFTAFTTTNAATSTRTPSPCQSVSPTPSSKSQSSTPPCRDKKATEPKRQSKDERKYEHVNTVGDQTQPRSPPRTPVEESTASRYRDRSVETTSIAENDRGRSSRRRGHGSNNGNESSSSVLSVVYDVACCDGPVKFHRVLNENYSSTDTCGPSALPQTRVQRPCFEPETASSENDENGGPRDARAPFEAIEAGIDAANSSESYTCGYCRHTFKSQYCYRKHTKRHLLPTRVNDSTGHNRQRQEAGRNRREVRLLDLNVQYYPCKICGCKFPSYYFVHKHRKLCHGNVEERTQSDEANSIATEDQESTTSTTNNERQGG